jgi:hypothetical protein
MRFTIRQIIKRNAEIALESRTKFQTVALNGTRLPGRPVHLGVGEKTI